LGSFADMEAEIGFRRYGTVRRIRRATWSAAAPSRGIRIRTGSSSAVHFLELRPGRPLPAKRTLNATATVAYLLHRALDFALRSTGLFGFIADFVVLPAGDTRAILLASPSRFLRTCHVSPLCEANVQHLHEFC
jgi:hypothetical protein